MFRRLPQLALFVFFSLITVSAPKAPAENTVQLARSGLHLAADKVRGGGDWWGIFPEGDGYILQPTRVRVEAVVDPLADGDMRKTATLISVPGEAKDVLLFRGLMSASAGPLASVHPSKSWLYLSPGDTIEMPSRPEARGGGTRIVARGKEVVKKSGPSEVTVVSAYQLILIQDHNSREHTQLLSTFPEFSRFSYDQGPSLVWAGDLDRDGRLDLLYNFSTIYTNTELALFLSSAAKEGEIVGLVARWNARAGC